MLGIRRTTRLLKLWLPILGGAAVAASAAAEIVDADDIFDPGIVRTYYVTVDPADWEWLHV